MEVADISSTAALYFCSKILAMNFIWVSKRFLSKSINNSIQNHLKQVKPHFQLPKINDLLKLYNIRALNQLSQNFILNPNTLESLASSMGDNLDDQLVIEIGPGMYVGDILPIIS